MDIVLQPVKIKLPKKNMIKKFPNGFNFYLLVIFKRICFMIIFNPALYRFFIRTSSSQDSGALPNFVYKLTFCMVLVKYISFSGVNKTGIQKNCHDPA